MATQTKKAKETKMLTARELAEKAGISPALLRKLLRKEFNRAGKTVIEGNRQEYRFNPSDAVTKEIIVRAKALKEQPPEPQKESHRATTEQLK
jgi:hypothetical protein